jgi:hypothetical protein
MHVLALIRNSYLRYECKKLSFIPRTDLKYDRGTREYFKGCEGNNGCFYTYVLQHCICDREIFNINLYKIVIIDSIFYEYLIKVVWEPRRLATYF